MNETECWYELTSGVTPVNYRCGICPGCRAANPEKTKDE
jgi:hypothetical protein